MHSSACREDKKRPSGNAWTGTCSMATQLEAHLQRRLHAAWCLILTLLGATCCPHLLHVAVIQACCLECCFAFCSVLPDADKASGLLHVYRQASTSTLKFYKSPHLVLTKLLGCCRGPRRLPAAYCPKGLTGPQEGSGRPCGIPPTAPVGLRGFNTCIGRQIMGDERR